VHACWEVVDVGLLTSEIKDTDLGVGDTTVEPRLGVRLEVEIMLVTFPMFFLSSKKFKYPNSHDVEDSEQVGEGEEFALVAPTKFGRVEKYAAIQEVARTLFLQ
jgi:hypothetical protein